MILAEQSPGVCVADYDGDGWPDIYFPNGGDVHERKVDTRNALYHNNGDGGFTDGTEKPVLHCGPWYGIPWRQLSVAKRSAGYLWFGERNHRESRNQFAQRSVPDIPRFEG